MSAMPTATRAAASLRAPPQAPSATDPANTGKPAAGDRRT
jgi:hypothetical protein